MRKLKKRTGYFKETRGIAYQGILLITVDGYNIFKWRKVFFYPTSNPVVSLSQELSNLLDDIRLG